MPTENRSSNIEIAKILSPFAAVADCYSDAEDDSFEPARDRGQHKDLALTLGQFRAVRALLDHPMACRHEWTDDGEWQLACTKCGAQENHEPYGWVQTRGPAINQFTQEWDIVQEWEDQGFQYKAMHDHPAPAVQTAEPVAYRHIELDGEKGMWFDAHPDSLKSAREDVERGVYSKVELAYGAAGTGEVERLRAQVDTLTEWYGNALNKLSERDTLLNDIARRHWSGVDFDLPADLVARIQALSASEELSAPAERGDHPFSSLTARFAVEAMGALTKS